MTDTPRRRTRLSKRALRASAWVAGGVAFLSPWAVLSLSPRPAVGTQAAQPRQTIIVRRITRRVIVRQAPKDRPIHYVYADGGSSGTATGTGGGSATGSGSGSVSSPPPTTHTGGSGGG